MQIYMKTVSYYRGCQQVVIITLTAGKRYTVITFPQVICIYS